MNETQTWNTDYSVETSASPETIWGIFRDVDSWKSWNAGIAHIEIDGPFATSTWFTMQPPGQEAFRSCLTEVRENECFVDETRIGDIVVSVAHNIEALSDNRTRITYSVEVNGSDAAEVGSAVSGDFPEVLAALVKLAEARST